MCMCVYQLQSLQESIGFLEIWILYRHSITNMCVCVCVCECYKSKHACQPCASLAMAAFPETQLECAYGYTWRDTIVWNQRQEVERACLKLTLILQADKTDISCSLIATPSKFRKVLAHIWTDTLGGFLCALRNIGSSVMDLNMYPNLKNYTNISALWIPLKTNDYMITSCLMWHMSVFT